MKITVLKTYSLSCNPIYEPLVRLGHELQVITYHQLTRGGPEDYSRLVPDIDAFGPDLVVMLGNNDFERKGEHVPLPSILREIAAKRPFVHICCDGSEAVWWPQLDWYRDEVPSMIHVNIDGVARGFFEDYGLTTLCPMDPATFKPIPWHQRPVRIGFCGGWGVGHVRGDTVEELIAMNAIHAIKRPYDCYLQYCEFLTHTKIAWNNAWTGSATHFHVKARVIEAALAGAVVLDNYGSPTEEYFVLGADFLAYESNEDVAKMQALIDSAPDVLAQMADNLRTKVIEQHSAEPFWDKVFALCAGR